MNFQSIMCHLPSNGIIEGSPMVAVSMLNDFRREWFR